MLWLHCVRTEIPYGTRDKILFFIERFLDSLPPFLPSSFLPYLENIYEAFPTFKTLGEMLWEVEAKNIVLPSNCLQSRRRGKTDETIDLLNYTAVLPLRWPELN